MNAYRLSLAATTDLAEIIEYIERESGPHTALKVFDEFHRAFVMLAAHPGLGHRHEYITEAETRVWNVYSYLVVYWPDESPLGIARILHGSRDLTTMIIPAPE